jgi:hypothetical protein
LQIIAGARHGNYADIRRDNMHEEKSHVGMGHEVCPICDTKHTESVLLNKYLRKTLTRDMVTGLSLCPEHKKMSGEYVALVGVSNAPRAGQSRLNPEDAIRTGDLAHLKWEAADNIFNVKMDRKHPMVYVDTEVIEHLKKLQAQAV